MEISEAVLALEKDLKKRLIIEKIIIAASAAVFLTIGIICISLREASREVITHQIGSYTYETVTYNNSYVLGISLGIAGAITAAIMLFVHFLVCRFETVPHGGSYITVLRSMSRNSVYVNGEEMGRLGFFGWGIPTVEVWLPSKVKAIVTFSRSFLCTAQISFSDSSPSIEI